MTKNERIRAILRRAKSADVSMTRLCGLASINYGSWYRWRQGDQEPRESSLDRLESELSRLERAA